MRQGAWGLVIILLTSLSASCSESRTPHRDPPAEDELVMDPKLGELASLPEGIEVVHSPNPVHAVAEQQPGHRPTYRRVYRTTVRSKSRAVTVQEFGSFAWLNGRWVFANFTGQVFSGRDFAEWYSCPDGKLLPGREAIDPSNWSGGIEQLQAGKMRWYFIGVDEEGRRVKGEAIVDLAAEMVR